MAAKFPKGFHDAANALSGDYLLNAVYAWGLDHPQDAPTTPTANPGLNLLHETRRLHARRRHRLLRRGQHGGLRLDHRRGRRRHRRRRAGAAAHRRRPPRRPPRPTQRLRPGGRAAPRRRPGALVRPLPARLRRLQPHGPPALPPAEPAAAEEPHRRHHALPGHRRGHDEQRRRRTSRRRCSARSSSLAGDKPLALQSISFDPSLPDPNEPDGRFNTSRVDVDYMRQVVQNAFAATAPAPPDATTTPAPTSSRARHRHADTDGRPHRRPRATGLRRLDPMIAGSVR